MKSHPVVFNVVDERFASISHISHKQIKTSFDAFTKSSQLARKKERLFFFLRR